MKRKFVSNLTLLLFLNLLIKPFWIFGIDRGVQNMVGDESYGMYFALFNFSMLLNILLDLGISSYNNRNIARHNFLLKKHVANIVAIKLLLAIIYAVFTLTLAAIVGYNQVQVVLLLFLILNQFLISFTLYLRSNINALFFFRTDSLISVLDRSLMIILCGVLLFTNILPFDFTIEWFVYAQSIAYGLTCLVTLLILLRKTGRLQLRFRLPFFSLIIRKSLPYALLILLMSIYTRTDAVLLERLLPENQGKIQAGIYAQAYRLLDAVSMFGVLFAGLLLPIFAKMIKEKKGLDGILKLSYTLLLVPALIVAISSAYYGQNIMRMLYPASTAYSAQLLGILMFGFIGIATTYIFGTLLTANGSLKQLNLMALGGVFLNIGLNVLFIPELQALGSAYACVITQLITGAVQFVLAAVVFKFKPNVKLALQLILFIGVVVVLGTLSKQIKNWINGYLVMLIFSFLFAFLLKVLHIKELYSVLRNK